MPAAGRPTGALRLGLFCAVIASSCPANGLAQTAPPASPPSDVRPSPGDGGTLDLPQVDVTGQRSRARTDQQGPARGLDGSRVISNTSYLPVPVFELPRSVAVVTPERLEQLQVERPAQYFRDIPSVNFDRGEGDFSSTGITVRGLPAIRSLVDGMPYENAPYGTVGLYGIERVEVFEGPSAALQGGGNLGGTVNYVTKQPLDVQQTRVSLGTGFESRINRPLATAEIDTTGPINDKLSYRVIAGFDYRQRFYTPAVKDDQRGHIDAGLRWRPDADTTVLLQAFYSHNDVGAGIDSTVAQGTVLPNPKGYTIPYGRTFTDPTTSSQPLMNAGLRAQFDRKLSNIWSINAGLHYNYESFTYRDVLILGSLADDGRTLSRSGIHVNFRDVEVGGRVNLTGDFKVAGRPNLLVVGYDVARIVYHDGEYRFDTVRPIDIVTPDYSNPIIEQTRAPAQTNSTLRNGFFINDRLTILPGVELYGGVRGDTVQQVNVTAEGGDTARLNDSAVSGNAGVSWAVRPDTRIYFGWSQAFNPQDPGTLSAPGQTFAPLTGEQYEVGVKHIVNDRLSLAAALFHINESNVLTPDPANPLFSVPTGQVRSQGGEVSVNGTIARGWSVSAGYAYLDTTITKDNAGNAGRRQPNVPRHGVRLFSIYEVEDGRFQGFGIGGGLRYASGRYADNANTIPLPDYTVFDAVAYYKLGRHKLQLNVENLTDRHYYPSGTGPASIYYGQPFTAYLKLSSLF